MCFRRLSLNLRYTPIKCVTCVHTVKSALSLRIIRITLPISAHDSAHDVGSVSKTIRTLVTCIEGEVDRDTLQSLIGIKHRTYFRSTYLKPALDEGYIEFTLPNEKQSKLQKYRLTPKGIALQKSLKEKE